MLWEKEEHLFSFFYLKHEEGKIFNNVVLKGGRTVYANK